MNPAELPPPPPKSEELLTREQIIGHIRDHWATNLGATEHEATVRAERGFEHMLATRALGEWGFTRDGETLYEPQTVVSEAVVYIIRVAD